LAYELYFRIQEDEQPFAAVATLYSEGPEARTAGLIGLVDLGSHNGEFAQSLISQPVGELTLPARLGPWFRVLRIEEKIPARLDEAMEQPLLDELFEQWVSEQMEAALPQT
jgi:parvulin-like peptidyl-prolyl isomerase